MAMSTKRLVQTEDDRLTLLALGREVVVLAALDGVEHDVAGAVELEGVGNRHGSVEASARESTDVLRLVEEPAGNRDVRFGEGATVRKDWGEKDVSKRIECKSRWIELTGEREGMESLVLVGVGDGRGAKE